MSAPLVSVLLPTRQGAADLKRLLPVLRSQVLEPVEPGGAVPQFEVLAIDSSSTDGTRSVLEAFGVQYRTIPKAEFGHGRTRNALARLSRAPFLVFLSQDVMPTGTDFLAGLLASFDDPRVAGAYCRVLPNPDSDLLSARTVLDLPEATDRPYHRDLDGCEGLWTLTPEQRVKALRFNNVASAVRASVFAELPFPDVSFAEDFAWAARALTAGHRLAYTPACSVYHSHRYGLSGAFERYRVDAFFHARAHGWRMRPTLGSALRGWAYEVVRDFSFLRERGLGSHLSDAARAPFLRGAQIAGQYLGSKGYVPRRQNPAPLRRDWSLLEG